ncbi:MAG: pyridoxamine 5'-phosphate oxidase family protein [Candidatus Cloacimonetes bacterium]|nr:pyridoxamine 5'-phosphate oxidase family protein [Candidatus Cloacimonadota bacterium]
MNIDILDTLAPTQMVHLATCEGNEPRLRPMTLIAKARRLWFATGSGDNKSAQIAANPNAEFCLLLKQGEYSGYLRGRGKLLPVTDIGLKQEVADHATFIYDYFGDASDPDYCLYELELRQLRHIKPGEMYEEVLDL